jgi:hypothetical protein
VKVRKRLSDSCVEQNGWKSLSSVVFSLSNTDMQRYGWTERRVLSADIVTMTIIPLDINNNNLVQLITIITYNSEERPVGATVFYTCLIIHSVGLFGREISPSQGCCLYIQSQRKQCLNWDWNPRPHCLSGRMQFMP